MISRLIVLVILFQISILSCDMKNDKTLSIDNIELFQKNIEYPYKASEKRKVLILDNMNKLKKGMTKEEVINLMTQPDEVNLTYKFIKTKSNNVIGFSLVYILKRDMHLGSFLEKKEQLLRIHFDNSGKLTWSYSQGIGEFNAIEKK